MIERVCVIKRVRVIERVRVIPEISWHFSLFVALRVFSRRRLINLWSVNTIMVLVIKEKRGWRWSLAPNWTWPNHWSQNPLHKKTSGPVFVKTGVDSHVATSNWTIILLNPPHCVHSEIVRIWSSDTGSIIRNLFCRKLLASLRQANKPGMTGQSNTTLIPTRAMRRPLSNWVLNFLTLTCGGRFSHSPFFFS